MLLVAFDTPPPPALQPFRAVSVPFGVALLLTPEALPGGWVRLQDFKSCPLVREDKGIEPLSELERWLRSNPAAHSLPLLHRIANRQAGAVQLPYLPGDRLEFQVTPC